VIKSRTPFDASEETIYEADLTKEELVDYSGLEKTKLNNQYGKMHHNIRPSDEDGDTRVVLCPNDVALFYYERYRDPFKIWMQEHHKDLHETAQYRVSTSDNHSTFKICDQVFDKFCEYMKSKYFNKIYSIDFSTFCCTHRFSDVNEINLDMDIPPMNNNANGLYEAIQLIIGTLIFTVTIWS
jgi:hypothetical protein